jgi:hypothetical protein
MDNTSVVSLVLIAVVATVTLATWLILIFHADSHPR